jgi:hypothetical protein
LVATLYLPDGCEASLTALGDVPRAYHADGPTIVVVVVVIEGVRRRRDRKKRRRRWRRRRRRDIADQHCVSDRVGYASVATIDRRTAGGIVVGGNVVVTSRPKHEQPPVNVTPPAARVDLLPPLNSSFWVIPEVCLDLPLQNDTRAIAGEKGKKCLL